MEEIKLIKQIQGGDLEAFERLFEMHRDKALRTVYLITKDPVVSEDIVQEAFITCYRSIKGLKNPEYFKTWFYRILTRSAWRYMKKERELVPVEDIIVRLGDNYEDSCLEKLENQESSQLLYQEISKLAPKLRMTIILYYYNEFSIKEVSQTMDCLEGTVKSRLYTGRKRLKKVLVEKPNSIIIEEVLGYEGK